jgi:hypothetical protein
MTIKRYGGTLLGSLRRERHAGLCLLGQEGRPRSRAATDQPGAMALTRTRPQGRGYTHAAPLCGPRATARGRTAMDKATKQTREGQRLGRWAITASTELTGLPVIGQTS